MARSSRRILALLCAALLLSPGGALAEDPKQAVLDVPGMNCSLYAITVITALQRYDGEKATAERLSQAVSDAAYPATVVRK
jgi:copper chaperone CopZ